MALTRSKIGGTWSYSIYVPGSPHRLRGSCGTSDKAEALAVEALVRMAAGRNTTRERLLRVVDALYPPDTNADNSPLEALHIDLTRAEELAGREVSRHSLGLRRQNLAALAAWAREYWPAAKTLRDVDRRCAQAFARWLARQGKSQKTIRNRIGIFSAIWNLLKRVHDNLENPWPLALPAPAPMVRRGAFTPEEVRRLVAAADEDCRDWGLACRIAAATGLRMGDVITLRFGDIQNGAVDREPRKTKKHGIVVRIPLPSDLLSMIGAGEAGRFIMPALGSHYNGHNLTGVTEFSTIMERAGVEANGRTFHSFRHYFRSQLAAAGVPEAVAMRLGGWTRKETAARYDHNEHRAESESAINAAWALMDQRGLNDRGELRAEGQ